MSPNATPEPEVPPEGWESYEDAIAGLPGDPVIALVIFTRRRDVMGSLVNRRATSIMAIACTALILALNALLIVQTFGGKVPGIS